MNELIDHFRVCCFTTGEILSRTNGQVIREFGLNDFLENYLTDDVDSVQIAIKALEYFCLDASPNEIVYRFAVLAVCDFLHRHHANLKGKFDSQSAIDLVSILKTSFTEASIKGWIKSHFK